MRSAYRLVMYLLVSGFLLTAAFQSSRAAGGVVAPLNGFKAQCDLSRVFNARFGEKPFVRPLNFAINHRSEVEVSLYDAVTSRLGAPYRSNGTDNRGYDCSGFVWRVFQEAGIDFTRGSARTLWENLPPTTGKDARRFGTLVFFRGLSHVGIVRDDHSFYHASSSQGVVRSYYSDNDDYWKTRVIGFRRVPLFEEDLAMAGHRSKR